ncbi:MAG TPA: VOC family protein [Gemmatimonadales bacterium]|nr:VOC family protein [Gemmatimonadales bacterium]
MPVPPIPPGYHTVTPYLIVPGVPKLIEFLHAAFGAGVTREPVLRPDGSVMHAEVQIGTSRVMMAEPIEAFPAAPVSIFLYVEDADATFQRALDAGGAEIMAMATQPHGDRYGGVRDPSGNSWWVATHVEDVDPAELDRREKALAVQQAGAVGASS